MVIVVLLLAVGVTAYAGWLMWHAPASTPQDDVARRAQKRAMKRRLEAAMSGRAGDSSAQHSSAQHSSPQWSFTRPSPGRS